VLAQGGREEYVDMSRKNRGVKFAASLRKREQYRGPAGPFRRKVRPCQVYILYMCSAL
jgi:hypothetical protein